MNYPIWDIPLLGGGMLIGIIAVTHVFVSHFAIGGGFYLVCMEAHARRTQDSALLDYVKQHSRFFMLVVLVFGAVTGVGIWWTIGLVHPSATSTLIHVFVWGWAIEWTLFLTEIIAAYIYYYGWERLDAKTHLTVGWIYAVAAWGSLLVINGILTFMLTPGRWLETRSFWDGWINPTMLPSLFVRTSVCIALAGVYGLLTSQRLTEEKLRAYVVKAAGQWLVLGALLLAPCGIWYVFSLPDSVREMTMGGAPTVTIFAGLSVLFSAMLVIFGFFGAVVRPAKFEATLAFVLATLAFLATAVTEWVREAARKPYIISGYMYSNALLKEDVTAHKSELFLPKAKFTLGEETGKELFRLQCQSCHTVNAFNGIKFAVKGWPEDFIDRQISHLDTLKGFMPPFVGTEEERKALSSYLYSLNPPPSELEAKAAVERAIERNGR